MRTWTSSSAKTRQHTICYNQREEWNDRQEAIKFFRDAMMNSEGSEHERYFKIWSELETGETICSDERLPTVKRK